MTKTPPKEPKAKASPAKKAPQRGLGRGLSSLLGDAGVAAATANAAAGITGESASGTVQNTAAATGDVAAITGLAEIPVEWINSGPWQPRRRFDNDALTDLANSVRQKGVVQPILVRPHPKKPQRYELIAGERRWRAAQMAQLHVIPAIVRPFTDSESYEIALIENVQRADLTVIEEAEGYQQLIETYNYTQAQLSELIGKSRSHIANLLRLLSLPPKVSDLVMNGTLTMGQVRPLIGHDNVTLLALEVAKKGLSARQVEALVKRGDAKPKAKPEKSADIRAIEQKAAIEHGLKLDIDWDYQTEKGVLKLRCENFEQMNAVLEKMGLV